MQEEVGAANGDGAGGARYRSPLRAERAADTRSRIAVAARELFVAHGFGGTTVAAIAERAGVAPQTVYATFGSKGAIIGALLVQMEEDADAARWRDRIAAATEPNSRLVAFAEWTRSMFSTSKAMIAAAQGAAGDPAIVDLRRQGDLHRREALEGLIATLARAHALRADLPEAQAVDRAWMLTGVELYLAATDGCGWSDADYALWLAALLQSQLLEPAAALSEGRRGTASPP